jgi:hypothetical protein
VLVDGSGETERRYGVRSYATTLAISPEGLLLKGDAVALLREHLMATTPGVRKLLDRLRASFGDAVGACTRSGDAGAFALLAYARSEATREQVKSIARALARTRGRWALVFFAGNHGLRSAEPAARIAAAEALGPFSGEEASYALWAAAVREEDPAVEKVLRAVLKKREKK